MSMPSDWELSAFSRVEFHSVCELQQVWMDRPPDHIPLHKDALRRFSETLERASHLSPESKPLGLCIYGPAGSGKTHLLGEIRREAARQQANFVLSDLTDVRDFWSQLAMHYLQSLRRSMNGVQQLQRILEVLFSHGKKHKDVTSFLAASLSMPRDELVAFANDLISALRPIYGQELISRLRVFRALLYLDSEDLDLSERAYSFLQGVEQIDEESKKIYLIGKNSPRKVATDLAWFLSLCGPTVLAFDQLDPFVAQNNLADSADIANVRLREALYVLFDFVNGVMAIREEFARTLIVVTCLESSWKVLIKRAVESFLNRFEEPENLPLIRGAEIPRELVAKRLSECYQRLNFIAPYPAWPFTEQFFQSIPNGLTPREILTRCERHRLACTRAGQVTELDNYANDGIPGSKEEPKAASATVEPLNELFARELAAVNPVEWLEGAKETNLGEILGQAARIFRRELELGPDVAIEVDTDFRETRQYESLHVRLRRIFHLENEREEHVCVRILQKAHAVAFQVRLRAALTTSGMSEKLEGRRLVLLRNNKPPAGVATTKLVDHAITECGAEFLPLSAEDIKTLVAIVNLSDAGHALFETWLLRNVPLSKTSVFRNLVPSWIHSVASKPLELASKKPTPAKSALGSRIFLGHRLEAGSLAEAVYLPAVDLARHVILRAGSGGGKTVFIKRVVEEAALCGIPSIVLDTAKDLSMLGDRWANPPDSWAEFDMQQADQYFKNIEVNIWTPGHPGGRPVRVAALPNLSGPFEEPYARDQVIEVAVAGLIPLAVQKKSHNVEKAILKKVVEWLTRQPPHSGNELERLIAALRDLPAEAFQGYQNERKLAAGMADQIQATMVADPLYGAQGEDLDPAVLFGVTSARTRISVLSLFALTDIETQARFIGQVASVLFNWIRRNPAPTGSPIRGLLVLDEAARFLPRNNAESKPALMLLAAQARKYGLGLILATQNPMDLDYNATANFATHIFGTANATQVVRFIQEAMEQRGMSGLNPAQLKTGQFFCATPSLDRPARIQGPMCLSAHPHNTQLTDDEILERSRRLHRRLGL